MTPRERIARLAAILRVDTAVTLAKYRGPGERSDRHGRVTAKVASYSGHGPDENAALAKLAYNLENFAMNAGHSGQRAVESAKDRAAQRRRRATYLRDEAAKEDADADAIEAEGTAALTAAQATVDAFAAYLAERGTDPGDDR